MHQQCTMKSSHYRLGIKVWVLAHAVNGFISCCSFTLARVWVVVVTYVGLRSMVVLYLMVGLVSNGLHLYTNKYCISPSLFQHMYNRRIHVLGSARALSPRQQASLRYPPAESPLQPLTVKRWKKDNILQDVMCPLLLPDYQESMRGVDMGISCRPTTTLGVGQRSG